MARNSEMAEQRELKFFVHVRRFHKPCLKYITLASCLGLEIDFSVCRQLCDVA